MNQKIRLPFYKLLPYLNSILFGMILLPMFLEGWFNFEIFSVVIFMCFLIFKFTKYWINNKNFLLLIISFLLLISYPLKYSYIYYSISVDNFFIVTGFFDFAQTNYLDISNEKHILFISYVTSAFLGLFAVTFFKYKISFDSIKLSLENLAKNNSLKIFFTNKYSNYFFLFFTLFFTIIYTRFAVGIVTYLDADLYRLPFGLDSILQLIQKYIIIIYGFGLIYFNKTRNNRYILSLLTKCTLYSYILFTGLFTTSKEYILLLFISLSIEIIFLKLKKLKSKTNRLLVKSFILFFNTLILGLLLIVAYQARSIRNTTLCSDCGGIQTIFFLFDFLISNGGFDALYELLDNSWALNINYFDAFLFGTLFRLQGADNLIQIMSNQHNNPVLSYPDLFGFFESFSTIREAGYLFFADILNYSREAQTAFAPSLLGSSLQISNSIFNPFIFTFSSCFFFLNLIALLIKSNFPVDIIFALIILFDFLRGISEGSFSYLIPLLAIFSLTINYFVFNKKSFLND